MSDKVLIFYDIPSTEIGAWTPNAWKARFVLNYKGIPYKTEWVEYPDIAEKFQKLGITPTSKNADGSPQYTCPAIYDPSTNTYVSESTVIAEYLEKTYPDTPKLFPPGTNALQHAFADVWMQKISPIFRFIIPKIFTILNPASQPYFRRTREIAFGNKMEEITPTGKARVQAWGELKAGLDAINTLYEKGKEDGPYLLGKKPGYVDVVVVAWIFGLKRICGEDSQEWKDVSSWNNGRWASVVDAFSKYQATP